MEARVEEVESGSLGGETMTGDLEQRVAALEATLQRLEFQFELEAIRKKRAGKIRLAVIVVVGGLYIWYMQRALSGIL
jgi:hypothetical protein